VTNKPARGKKKKSLMDWQAKLNLIDKIPVGISASTLEGEILEVNSSLIKVFGYKSKKDFLKRKADAYWLDAEKGRNPFVQKLKEEGKVEFFRAPFKKKDGSVMWGSINAVIE
jgi:PAS domain S-box-containing protein